MGLVTVAELDALLRHTLIEPAAAADSVDVAFNGLQVPRTAHEVSRVAFSVDAGMEVLRRSAEWGADLLFVHHGLFWGKTRRLSGPLYERVRFLLKHDMGLYAVHLPLDAHPGLGNNAGMASVLELQDLSPFGDFRGVPVGWAGHVSARAHPDGALLDDLIQPLFGSRERCLGVLPFGPERIHRVGLVSGGAPREVAEAVARGLDLYITGDASHEVYHDCQEAGINVVFGGHYQTETWGPRLVCRHLAEHTALETTFVDVPTGL